MTTVIERAVEDLQKGDLIWQWETGTEWVEVEYTSTHEHEDGEPYVLVTIQYLGSTASDEREYEPGDTVMIAPPDGNEEDADG